MRRPDSPRRYRRHAAKALLVPLGIIEMDIFFDGGSQCLLARVYLKTPNAPGQRVFSRCTAPFFLEIRQYSCEKMSCSTQKFLAAGHIGSFQIHPRQPRIRNQRPQAAPFRHWLRSFSLRYTKQRCGKLLVRNEKTSVCGAARKSPPEASDGLFLLFSYAVLPLQIVSFFMRVILTNL